MSSGSLSSGKSQRNSFISDDFNTLLSDMKLTDSVRILINDNYKKNKKTN